MIHGPGGELLVVRRPDLPDALVPFVRAIVPTVDLAGGRVVLTPPDGLLDLASGGGRRSTGMTRRGRPPRWASSFVLVVSTQVDNSAAVNLR